MMARSMEVLYPPSPYFSNPFCILGREGSGGWTQQENKRFENALALVDIQSPEGWAKVAAMTGRSVSDVMSRYRVLEIDVGKIESGDFPFTGYRPSSFTLDWEDDQTMQPYCVGAKRSCGRMADQERKKGVPWTEEEHKLFLMGLKKYGKGDWRNISRNFVYTRTPTQVASHAQKYFIRLNSGGKDKRRASIHDITTVNLPENNPSSPSQTSGLTTQSNSAKANGRPDQLPVNEAASIFTPSGHSDRLMQLPYSPYGVKFESQDSFKGALRDSMVGCHPMFN
ncbi:transcription factor DIVARICATA-like [Iris pallida]|uniref:Transcription factor MYBS1 n=1 Tax=Iris pallida TaxID=29817 RepID=A0AAX6DU56_IRIPA|nr:transcription factor DIVARICATA-like [Iris pallida]KAJ6826765.1 transcription factor DIVARICATA-like [Iris pallida]